MRALLLKQYGKAMDINIVHQEGLPVAVTFNVGGCRLKCALKSEGDLICITG